MHADHVERIVVAEAILPTHRLKAHEARNQADHQSGEGLDVSRGGCDRREASHGPGGRSDRRGLPRPQPLRDEPSEHRRDGSQLGVHERTGGERTGSQGTAGVEPEPAEPKDPGTQDHERDVVRPHVLGSVAAPPAEVDRGRQSGGARIGVHDRAPGEVEGSHPVRAQEATPSGRPGRRRRSTTAR